MFFKPKQKQSPIYVPTWEEVIERCYDQGLSDYLDPIAKVVYNSARSRRVVILARPHGGYRISEEKLIPSCDDDLYCYPDVWGFWMQYGSLSIFDSIESAEKEALHLLELSS